MRAIASTVPSSVVGALAGIACGLLTAAPLAVLLQQDEVDLGRGMLAVAFPFIAIQLLLLLVRLRWRSEVVPFGALAATTFLLVTVVAVIARECRK